MERRHLDAIHEAIRESLAQNRAARSRQFCAETQPADSWIEDGSRNATMSVVETLQRLGLIAVDDGTAGCAPPPAISPP